MMLELACLVDRQASRSDVDGIVITHGTDTLEETVYLLDLVVRTEKPVCITGAMRGAQNPGADGPANLLAAVRTAAERLCRRQGCPAGCFNDEIHACC
jgi:L-asparaginase